MTRDVWFSNGAQTLVRELCVWAVPDWHLKVCWAMKDEGTSLMPTGVPSASGCAAILTSPLCTSHPSTKGTNGPRTVGEWFRLFLFFGRVRWPISSQRKWNNLTRSRGKLHLLKNWWWSIIECINFKKKEIVHILWNILFCFSLDFLFFVDFSTNRGSLRFSIPVSVPQMFNFLNSIDLSSYILQNMHLSDLLSISSSICFPAKIMDTRHFVFRPPQKLFKFGLKNELI